MELLRHRLASVGEELAGLSGQVSQTRSQLLQKDKLMAQRDGEVELLRHQLLQKDELLAKRDGEVELLRHQLLQKDELLAKRDGEVELMRHQLLQKDDLLAKRDDEAREKDELLARRDDEVANISAAHSEVSNRLVELDRKLNSSRFLVKAALKKVVQLPRELLKQWLANKRIAQGLSALFDKDWYLLQYPDVATQPIEPLQHYLKIGGFEGRDPSVHFDSDWYLSHNPDVAAKRINPLLHYLRHGGFEGRDPNPNFDSDWYLWRHPDVAAAGLNPLLHYVTYGAAEGRSRLRSISHPASSKLSVRGDSSIRDRFIVLPFRFAMPDVTPAPKLVVMFHCYYVDEIPRFKKYFANIPFDFSLIVTTDTEAKKEYILDAFSDSCPGSVNVVIVENRGRDAAPRFVNLRETYAHFDYVLHVHTKKSRHTEELKGWLPQLLDDLIGSRESVRSIFEIFTSDPDVGVIAPRYFPLIRRHIEWGSNYGACQSLAQRLGVPIRPHDPIEFPAGSMFWARTAALRPLLDLALRTDDFEPEHGQKDDTLAHALERMIFISSELAGYSWCFVGTSQKLDSQEPITVSSPAEIANAIKASSRPLTINCVAQEPHLLKDRFRKQCAARLSTFLATQEGRIVFNTSETPDVSVIIVLYNSAELTFEHLRSLQNALSVPCEVIIVDNGSTDRTRSLLERVDGARVFLNTSNRHFVLAVNQGAREARGNYILLVNNDTRIKRDAIATGRRLLLENATIGAVGGKVLLLDGTLQEAGSIIWDDGSCSGYGRGQDPNSPEFEFRRDVDYCSAVFLMLRADLFAKLGWLDESFAPAYYEETDLCMRIRAAGYRVVYEPSIEILHFEFGSSSSPADALALQARNHKLFRTRHKKALVEFHCPRGSSELKARSVSLAPRVLIIDDRVPYPYLGAGYPRAAALLEKVHANGWLVTFYPLVFPHINIAEARSTFPAGVEFVPDRGAPGLAAFLRERIGYFDAVLVSRPHNMEVFQKACSKAKDFAPNVQIIYDAEARFVEREALRRRIRNKPYSDSAYKKALAKEIDLTRGADSVIAVSEQEKSFLSSYTQAPVHVLGHCITAKPDPRSFSKRRDILFVGALIGSSDKEPNVDSLIWFVREIMPLLDRTMGAEYRLRVAGRVECGEVRALSSDRVEVLGIVPDLSELYGSSRVFIAPTRFAAGIPHKVHEATAYGLPTVATNLIASQLGWKNGYDIMTGDTPVDFAKACHRLYTDANLWTTVRTNSLARLTTECSVESFNATVREMLADIAAARRPLTRN